LQPPLTSDWRERIQISGARTCVPQPGHSCAGS